MGLEQDIKVRISAIVAGLNEVKKFQAELQGIQKASGKKLSIETGGSETGINKLTNLFRFFSAESGVAIQKAEGISSALGGIFSAATGPLGIILALVGAIVALAKNAADAGGEIYDLSQQTGFAAETLSALKNAAETSGGSIETVSNALGFFNAALAKAREEGSKADPVFKLLGKDISDNEAALRKAFKILYATTNEEMRSSRARTFFSKSAKDVLGIIKETNGNLDAAIEKYRKMNTLITGEAAAAADKFSDSMHETWAEIKGVGRELGEGLIPSIFSLAHVITTVLVPALKLLKIPLGVVGAIAQFAGDLIEDVTTRQDELLPGESLEEAVGQAVPGPGFRNEIDEDPLSGGKGGESKAEKARQERLRVLERQGRALAREQKNETEGLQREYEQQRINLEDFTQETITKLEKYYADRRAIVLKELALAKTPAEKDKSSDDLKALDDERDKAITDIRDKQAKTEEDALRKHKEELLKLAEAYDKREIDNLRAGAERRASSFEAAERRVAQIEQAAANRRWEDLVAERERIIKAAGGIEADANQERLREINDAIDALDALERKTRISEDGSVGSVGANVLERQRRIQEAIKRDLEEARNHLEEIRSLQNQNLQIADEIGRARIDHDEQLGILSPKAARKARDAQDLQAEIQRGLQEKLDIIAEDRSRSRYGLSLEERQKLDAAFKERLELAEIAHQDRMREIQERPLVRLREKLHETANIIGDILGTALQDGIEGGVREGLSSALQGFKQWLFQMLTELLKAKLFELLQKIFNVQQPGQSGQGTQISGGGGAEKAKQSGGSGIAAALGSVFRGLFNNLFNSHAKSVNTHVDQGAGSTVDSVYKNTESTKAGLDDLKKGSDTQIALLEASLPQAPSLLSTILSAVIGAAAQVAIAKVSAGGGGGSEGTPAAEGGHITGPGTSTSDSIPAWLSNGEYVIRAASVRKLGTRFLDYINMMGQPPAARRFALGGAAGDAPFAGAEAFMMKMGDKSENNNYHLNIKDSSRAHEKRVPSRAAIRDIGRALRGMK
jgi:hypothetical protein